MISESKILDHAHQVLRSEAEAILAVDTIIWMTLLSRLSN